MRCGSCGQDSDLVAVLVTGPGTGLEQKHLEKARWRCPPVCRRPSLAPKKDLEPSGVKERTDPRADP